MNHVKHFEYTNVHVQIRFFFNELLLNNGATSCVCGWSQAASYFVEYSEVCCSVYSLVHKVEAHCCSLNGVEICNVRYDIFTAFVLKMQTLWDVTVSHWMSGSWFCVGSLSSFLEWSNPRTAKPLRCRHYDLSEVKNHLLNGMTSKPKKPSTLILSRWVFSSVWSTNLITVTSIKSVRM
jgi:hypothetical protein